MAFANADELSTAEWMEGMGYVDKVRRSGGNVCIQSWVTSGWRKAASSGRHRLTA